MTLRPFGRCGRLCVCRPLRLGAAALLISLGDPTNGALPIFYFPARDIALGAAIALVLGVLSGAMPAWEAMRLRIAEALRRA